MYLHETHTIIDPRCPFTLLSFHLKPAHHSGVENWHDDLEILFFTDGVGEVSVDDERFDVKGGDTVIVNSGELHRIEAIDHLNYICLIVNPEFCKQNFVDIHRHSFTSLAQDSVLTELGIRLLEEYPVAGVHAPAELSADDRRPERVIMRRTLVLQILARIFCNHRRSVNYVSKNTTLHGGLKIALEYIGKEYPHDISLDEIAVVAGMSKYHFAREFRKCTRHTFTNYVNLLRCEKAKSLLTNGDLPMNELCRLCGFSDQSYFSRIFMRTVGTSPTEYRRQSRGAHSQE